MSWLSVWGLLIGMHKLFGQEFYPDYAPDGVCDTVRDAMFDAVSDAVVQPDMVHMCAMY